MGMGIYLQPYIFPLLRKRKGVNLHGAMGDGSSLKIRWMTALRNIPSRGNVVEGIFDSH
jgi:hypothetical protein